MLKGKDRRLSMPFTPRPPSRPSTPVLSSEETFFGNSIDTDSDESTVSVLSQALKQRLPPKNEARKHASPSPSSSEEETRESQLESTSRRKKPVSG